MPGPCNIKGRWIDRWLCSDAVELLEQEGATPQGIRIIDELNRVYRRTGIWQKMIDKLLSSARCFATLQQPVKVLEIGMRDGTLLRELGDCGQVEDIPLELHGVEFQANLVELACRQQASAPSAIQFHYAATRDLRIFTDHSFDLVYSVFVLHHQSPSELRELLTASLRLTRGLVFHLDLSRSLSAVMLIWSYYTLLGFRHSRRDAVLSCRRAYRPAEIACVLRELGVPQPLGVVRLPPCYWYMQYPLPMEII